MNSGLLRAVVQENAPGLASAFTPRVPTRGDYITAPEFEKDRAERMGMAETQPRHQGRAITSKRGRR
jgi:hypothetical protein